MAPPTEPSLGASTIPPPLPPSVEEAYRRKCIQLKQRLNEIEEANDASRVRLVRQRRGIEKLRLERAFLLTQLEQRTSVNVEDSDGSPSPPATPQEKPLRTKRGHRKPSFLTNAESANTTLPHGSSGSLALSPSGSDAFSHNNPEAVPSNTQPSNLKRELPNPANGHLATANSASPTTVKPLKNAFDLYCRETRDVLIKQNQQAFLEGTFQPDRALAQGWRDMDEAHRGDFSARFEHLKKLEKEAGNGVGGDEDVEMEDDDATITASEAGGFTAVNN